jgi:hypothetical protein
MITGIDHVVIAVPDLRLAADEFAQRTGLEVSPGGRHHALGTANRLVWLGDTYLEFVAVVDPHLATHSWIGAPVMRRLEHGPGLAMFALASNDVRADVGRLAGHGSSLGKPTSGERMRPDGGMVRWTLSLPGMLAPDRPPFLIEHEMTGPEWRAMARMERAMQRHPVGGRARLAWLEIEVDDPDAVAEAYRADLGLDPVEHFGDRFEVQIGGQVVRLAPVERVVPHRTPGPTTIVGIHLEEGPATRRVDVLGCRFDLEPTGR